MNVFPFYEAQFDVDVAATKACFAHSKQITDICPCESCFIYIEALEKMNPAVKQFALDLGIDLYRAGEVMALRQQDDEYLFMSYYTVVGNVRKTGNSTIVINDVTIFATTELEIVPEHFPTNVFQVHFQFTYEK